jgi:hypothetical protein
MMKDSERDRMKIIDVSEKKVDLPAPAKATKSDEMSGIIRIMARSKKKSIFGQMARQRYPRVTHLAPRRMSSRRRFVVP